MIWGLDPPRTHEKIISEKTEDFSCVFFLSDYRPERRSIKWLREIYLKNI